MLRATVMEMAANIKKLRPDVARAEHGFFLSEQSKTDNKDYWLELNENSPKPSISAYEALVEHFGVLLPDITARVMQFYEEIDLCYRQAKSLRGKEIDLDPEREEIHRLRPVVLSFGNAIHCWKDVVELSKINLSDFEEKADKLANRTIDQHSKSEIRALQGNISVEST
ncbi:hypothetical protein ACFQHZ_09045 [Marivibrio halodurans]|nr:hypothetical protein [Marivibrio halodurans]